MYMSKGTLSVTLVDELERAFLPELHPQLGLSLCVQNLVLVRRYEIQYENSSSLFSSKPKQQSRQLLPLLLSLTVVITDKRESKTAL
jgi:hypothetical protein